MFELLALSWKHYAFIIPLSLLSIFLMLVILVQRGRGGGLTGALGGMGGQSAFGTKAGDLFTRITIGVAVVWILLCMLTLKVLNPPNASASTPAQAKTTDKTKPGGLGPAAVPEGATTSDSQTTPPAGSASKAGDSKADDSTTGESPATSAPITSPTDDAKKDSP